jgi:hypothetical protein
MADNDPIRIGRTNNIETNNLAGTGTVLARAANSPRTDPVFTVQTPVGGDGIRGQASANNNGVTGASPNGFGVVGSSTNSTGVGGSSTNSVGAGGFSNTSHGVQGISTSGGGVVGFSNSSFGMSGQSTSGVGAGGFSNSSFGVSGQSTSSVGAGGFSNSSFGVSGQSTSGVGAGGFSNTNTGVQGVSTRGLGVGGFSTSNFGTFGSSTNSFGVRGVSTNSIGVSGVGSSIGVAGSGNIGVNGFSTSAFGGSFTGPQNTPGAGSLRLVGNIVKTGGEFSEALPHPDGSQRLLYAPLSPESWYEDFGRGELVEGRGRVEFDPDFAAILGIDDGHYHVFLTPEGDSNGLYVSSRNPTAFEVHEQQGGTSNLTFSYRVVAKRKDGQPERLAKLEEPESIDFARQEEEAPPQMMRQLPPPPLSPQPSMMPPSVDFVRLEEEHRGQIDELRRLVEEQRREMEELRRRVGPQEEAPPEST